MCHGTSQVLHEFYKNLKCFILLNKNYVPKFHIEIYTALTCLFFFKG